MFEVESIKLNRFVFGSICRSVRPGLSKDRLQFIRRTFKGAEPNATLQNKRVSYSCHAHTACFSFWNKMVGRPRRHEFLLLREHEMYLLEVHKPLLYAVSAVFHGKLRECSVFENRQFGSVLREKIKK